MATGKSLTVSSSVDQSAGIFEILRFQSIDCPVGQRADRSGRVPGGVPRKGRSPNDKDIMHVPALQVRVEDARVRIVTDDAAAAVVRRLVLSDGAWTFPGAAGNFLGVHCFAYFNSLFGDEIGHAQVIRWKIEGDP